MARRALNSQKLCFPARADMPLLNRAIELAAPANRPLHVVVKQRPQSPWPAERLEPGRDLDWDAALAAAAPAGCVSVPSTHPLYILYTSGSTGKPKGIVRDTAVIMIFSIS